MFTCKQFCIALLKSGENFTNTKGFQQGFNNNFMKFSRKNIIFFSHDENHFYAYENWTMRFTVFFDKWILSIMSYI